MASFWFLFGAIYVHHNPMTDTEFTRFLVITLCGYWSGVAVKNSIKHLITEAKKGL